MKALLDLHLDVRVISVRLVVRQALLRKLEARVFLLPLRQLITLLYLLPRHGVLRLLRIVNMAQIVLFVSTRRNRARL